MKRKITLCYRKVIGVNNTKNWEKLVFIDSYKEFKMQSQYYNQENKYHTFSELLHNVAHAEKLHFLVSGAIIDYVKQLNEIIPDITNNLGFLFLKFTHFRFEIINSDLQNMDKHVVAINFYSEELYHIDQIGDYLLSSKVNKPENEDGSIFTDTFTLVPYLTIHKILP